MTALPNPFAALVPGAATDVASAAQPAPDAAAPSGEDYIPELFLAVARRRSMAIVSPPLALPPSKDEPREWPRGFDPQRFLEEIEPPPLFLREPRPEFLRALLELGETQ